MAERSPPDSPAQQQVTAAAPPPPSKHTNDLNYMHRPPRIVPNYGKKHRGMLPKSNISRVLLYDNVTQQQMLDVKISHLRAEQRKTGRLMDMHRKSFIVRRLKKQRHVADTLLHVNHALPVLTIRDNHAAGWPVATGNAATHRSHEEPLPNVVATARNSAQPHPNAAADVVDDDGATSGDDDSGVPYVVEHHVRVDAAELVTGDTTTTTTTTTAAAAAVGGDSPHHRLVPSPLPSLAPPGHPHPHPHPHLSPAPDPRFGASTSHGFASQDPLGNRDGAGQRDAHTAVVYRELMGPKGHTPLPDIHHHHHHHGGRGGGGGEGGASGDEPDPNAAGKVVLRVDSDRNGLTRMMHTFHHPNHHQHHHHHNGWGASPRGRAGRGGGKGGGKATKEAGAGVDGGRTTEDERYRRLERLLVRIEPPNEGYLELSPSFHSPRQTMTFTRPSSFHSSSFRPRSSSSSAAAASPSISPLPLVVSSL